MKIIRRGQNLVVIGKFAQIAERLQSQTGRTELFRGVTDAGRKVKTKVQRAVKQQMALKPGNYGSYVVAGTRGIPKRASLSFEIFGVKKGAKVEQYQGLRVLNQGGKAAMRMNAGRSVTDKGSVRSGVWNHPRVFKRSFAAAGKFYMMRTPQAGIKAPRILWTHDDRSWQPRTAGGRFASTGGGPKWGRIRQLYGPSLMKEIPEDQSEAVFMAEGPVLLEQAITKRITKLMRF